jgi:hypothetical protein
VKCQVATLRRPSVVRLPLWWRRRALELERRGGARASVDEVEVLEVRSVKRDGNGGFVVDATWVVSSSVNHFGHVHYRQNRFLRLVDCLYGASVRGEGPSARRLHQPSLGAAFFSSFGLLV